MSIKTLNVSRCYSVQYSTLSGIPIGLYGTQFEMLMFHSWSHSQSWQ